MSIKLDKMRINLFRNIKDLTLNFGSRINIISGQNGVGKSNILSLIASGTGCSPTQFNEDLTSTDSEFQPDFMDYFVINAKLEDSIEPFHKYTIYSSYIDTTYEDNTISKYLRFKDDSNQQRFKSVPTRSRPIRIVPTTILLDQALQKKGTLDEAKEFSRDHDISYEGRIKIPTQYLSTSRLMPRGELETTSEKISNRSSYVTNNENEKYMKWYNEVIPYSISVSAPYKTTKGTLTQTVDERLESTSLRSISVGQDSLSKIISALINFDIIHNDPAYKGGILCIDEFDISLHPDAQNRLLSLLYRLSEKLDIQVFLTTHSLTAIKKFFRMKKNLNENGKDLGFIYLQDRQYPHLLSEPNYEKIAADLSLSAFPTRPNIKLYVEDEWTSRLLNLFLQICQSDGLLSNFDSSYVNIIPATFGKSNLLQLEKVDNNFQDSILVLDGDANYSDDKNYSTKDYILGQKGWPANAFKKQYANVVALPFPFSPEAFVYFLVNKYVTNMKSPAIREFWSDLDSDLPFERQFILERLLLNQDAINQLHDRLDTDILKGKDSAKKIMRLSDSDFEALNGFKGYGRDDRMSILFDVVAETHMCSHFYHSSEVLNNILTSFAKSLDIAFLKCQNTIAAKRI